MCTGDKRYEQDYNRKVCNHECQRRERRDGYPKQIRDNSSRRSPLMRQFWIGDYVCTTGLCLTCPTAFAEPKQQRSSEWKDHSEA